MIFIFTYKGMDWHILHQSYYNKQAPKGAPNMQKIA